MHLSFLSRCFQQGTEETRSHLRERYDDEEGPIDALVLHEVSDEGDSLDRFA